MRDAKTEYSNMCDTINVMCIVAIGLVAGAFILLLGISV